MKRVILLFVVIFIAGASFVAGKRYYFAHSGPKDDYQEAYWSTFNEGRRSVFETLPIDTGDIVFVGNSITEGFPLQEIFHSLKVKNRGICGNQSHHILERIGEIAAAQPSKIFLDVGINDILNHKSMDSLKLRYRAIIGRIRALSPRTKVYIQSVFPVGISQKNSQAQIDAFDSWLKTFCQEEKLTFIDLRAYFENGGFMNTAYTYDDIHLTGEGYKVWAERVRGYL